MTPAGPGRITQAPAGSAHPTDWLATATNSPAGPSSASEPSRSRTAALPPGQHVYHALGNVEPLYASEPFFNRIAGAGAWGSYNSTGAAPVVAVIDTGFALNHQDFSGRWDGSQGAADWKGWDFVDGDNNPIAGRTNPSGSAVFHGTMTAALAGLLNPAAKIMPLQALDDDGVGYTSDIASAVNYAANNGANIISLSLGTSTDDPTLHQAIDYAIGKGVLVVAAAGNDGCNCLSYPANYPEVLAVGATDSSDNPASFSSYGSNLDIMAPGTASDVCSAFFDAGNTTSAYSCGWSGTSFATPMVSGLAALLLEQDPGLTEAQLISTIEQTADLVPAMHGSAPTLEEGYGRINVTKAVTSARTAAATAYGASASTLCVGFPGAVCNLTLTGPSGQRVDLGQQTLDSNGSTTYSWSGSGLGLATGSWQLTPTFTAGGQTVTLPAQAVTLSW